MKNYFLFLLVAISCNQPNENFKEDLQDMSSIDSLITESQRNLISLDSTSKKTDSTITGKVEKTVKQIKSLEAEVKQLKEENNELKGKVDDANDVGKPFQLLPVSNGKNDR